MSDTPISTARAAVYGQPPADLASVPAGAVQLSPLIPGEAAAALEDLAPGGLGGLVMLAPPGTIERRYAMALALRSLAPGAAATILAPKARGGSRLRAELEAFGCAVSESSRQHHRICAITRPDEPAGLDEAIAAGAPRFDEALGVWTQPGIFSWDRVDPGSALLALHLGGLSGRGADLGCGTGFLARAVLAGPKVTRLDLVDIDRRAVACARRNVEDPRAHVLWADLRQPGTRLGELDFVVMNPPFHAGGHEDRGLGQSFIRAAAGALRRGGLCRLVANRHLPYEAVLAELFSHVGTLAEADGYKVFEARK